MKKVLKFEIECGENTCSSEPGKFCTYLNWGLKNGTCHFFGMVRDEDGYLIRHPECKKMAKNVKKGEE